MNLTYRYSAIQFTHWASSSGAAAFATTYLLNKGVPSGMVGFLLALAGLCSCLSQPVLASLADRAEKFVLTKMLLIMSVLCSVCILLQLLPGISIMLMVVLYMVSIWSSDAMVSLLNAISVAYNNAGYFVDYGAARGIGAVASAVSSAFGGMYHAMTENYMIVIMNALGGNSSHVGVALFIAAMVAAPVIFFFEKIRKVFRDTTVLKIAAVSFFIKAVGFYFAGNIQTIYLLQFFQISSYALLAPAQVYYAKEKVRDNDMVKGQAFITAAYALGCAAGNFAGGQLLSQGAGAILLAGICMAAAGTAIVFATVTKSDFCL